MPSSVTKVMTALLVIRAGDLGREIEVTKGAIRYVHKRGASSTLVGVLLHVNPTRNGTALFTAARKLLNWGFQRT